MNMEPLKSIKFSPKIPKEEWELKLEELDQIAYEYDVKRGKIKIEERKQKTYVRKIRNNNG